jgi:hypothetical protein
MGASAVVSVIVEVVPATIVVMAVVEVAVTVVEAVIIIFKAVSAGAPGKAQAPFRLSIHGGGGNINRLSAGVNGLRAGVINNLLLINGNGPINVNRLTCGLKRDTDTEVAAAISCC